MYQYFGGHIFFLQGLYLVVGSGQGKFHVQSFVELQFYRIGDTFKMSGVEGRCGSPNILVTSLVAVTKQIKVEEIILARGLRTLLS